MFLKLQEILSLLVLMTYLWTHPDPDKALSNGPNMLPLEHMDELLETLLDINEVETRRVPIEPNLG